MQRPSSSRAAESKLESRLFVPGYGVRARGVVGLWVGSFLLAVRRASNSNAV
jgi:hypothetical protein